MGRRRAARTVENFTRRFGFVRIAGVDEVGRGCLAGPVLVGAVVLDEGRHIPGLRDSKLLTAAARERLYDLIVERAAGWAIAECAPSEIDTWNIHRACLRTMRRAVMSMVPLPDFVLVDAFAIPDLYIPQRGIVGGDRLCACIAAASILAKVTRDRLMLRCHDEDPRYGYDRHKGYATADHLAALALHGYSPLHRRSFRPPSLFDTIDQSRADIAAVCEPPGVPGVGGV
jgi:ribonuclease HII